MSKSLFFDKLMEVGINVYECIIHSSKSLPIFFSAKIPTLPMVFFRLEKLIHVYIFHIFIKKKSKRESAVCTTILFHKMFYRCKFNKSFPLKREKGVYSIYPHVYTYTYIQCDFLTHTRDAFH